MQFKPIKQQLYYLASRIFWILLVLCAFFYVRHGYWSFVCTALLIILKYDSTGCTIKNNEILMSTKLTMIFTLQWWAVACRRCYTLMHFIINNKKKHEMHFIFRSFYSEINLFNKNLTFQCVCMLIGSTFHRTSFLVSFHSFDRLCS